MALDVESRTRCLSQINAEYAKIRVSSILIEVLKIHVIKINRTSTLQMIRRHKKERSMDRLRYSFPPKDSATGPVRTPER